MQSIALQMLGTFAVRASGSALALTPSSERVVAFVALHRGRASRPSVAGNLWTDLPEARAMANLRSALWRLRRPGLEILATDGDYLALAPGIRVDVRDLSAAARGVIEGGVEVTASDMDELAAGGELLGDWYDDWVLVEREHFRQLRLQALEQLARDLAARGEYGRAVQMALAAVSSEPLRESAHRALISVHLAQGNRSEAIRQYCAYQRLMRDELDLEPSSVVRDLMRDVPEAVVARVMGR